MMNKRILIVIVLIALSGMSCVSALDMDNATDNLNQQKMQDLESAVEQDSNMTLSRSDDAPVLESPSQSDNLSSGSGMSSYLVLDNDADKEEICLGDYVTWIISVENRGPDNAKKVKVFDQLPDGLKYVRHTATQGTFNPKTGIWDVGELLNGREVFLYITTLAVSFGEKINKANLTSQSVNLNSETYEEEDIDVFGCKNENSKAYPESPKSLGENSIRQAGNPIGLILMSLFGCLIAVLKDD